ncbi:Serine/threonine-protein kinase MRCK beta [Streptococcus pseudoporcinus]|uniref:Serine/threonine-protein kinase MRCK beta n=1 Tax=Streptococcus pseudoporcinus TaxID=361101 RepID=A0A4U9YA21_9STRE|nr:Serine/threonine-protein kinase MRCK beta [Streptococcus pseudoporcinus]
MKEIKCPHCQTVFTINESEYSQLLAQVRGQEFEKEITERLYKELALHDQKAQNTLQEELSQNEKATLFCTTFIKCFLGN